ncbi:helix-turn-helix transcriptional regulator [bacterium]|nr:helix-turn-helix transcriptional regulator [bacterium]
MDKRLRPLYLAFIKLHILCLAAEEEVYGAAIKEEFERHGYNLSYGTLYPILHGLEKEGYLKSCKRVEMGKQRKYYVLTQPGRIFFKKAKVKLKELSEELL